MKEMEYSEKLKYLEEVYRIRTFILRSMSYFGFEFKENKALVPKPNWNNRIKSNGAIGLGCCKNGLPVSLLTPWGEITFIDVESFNNVSQKRVEKFMAIMHELFDLFSMGNWTYSIGRIPWDMKFPCNFETKSRLMDDSEELLLDTYKEGKQLCIDLFGCETAL